MATKKRDITIEIQAETHKATADIKRLNSEIDRLNKKQTGFDKTTKSVNQMSRSFASLTQHVGKLAIIYGTFSGLQSTIRTFAEFEQSIKRLGVISGASAEELKQLETRAKDLGESTIYTASQVADGMNAMAMAGLNAQEQLEGISTVLSVATIGMISLEESALLTTRAMNSFGLESKNIGTIGDIIASGATSSAQSVTQLGNAYEKVGAIATAFGHSIQETTTALMIMADAGRVGSEAGTQLKIVMSRLAGNKEAKKYIEELGVSMYDANGQLLPFRDQLTVLKERLGELDEESRNIKLGEIFGEEGKASAIVLMNNLDKYKSKLDSVRESFGLAQRSATEMQDTLLGSYKELQSALEGLAIKIGQDLSPALRGIIQDATEFVQELDADEIANFATDIADLIKFLGELGSMFVEVTGFIAQTLASFEELTGVSSALVVVIGALALHFKSALIPALTKALPAITALGTAFAGVAVVVAGVTLAVAKATKQLNDVQEAVENSNEALDSMIDTTKAYIGVIKDLDEAGLKEGIANLTKEYGTNERKLRKLNAEMEKLKDSTDWGGNKDTLMQTLQYQINDVTTAMSNNEIARAKLTTQGIALAKVTEKQIALDAKEKASKNELADAEKDLAKATQDRVDKALKSGTSRVTSLEKGLATMLNKEKKYIADIEAIEKEKIAIHKKYSDERLSLNLSYESKVADLKNKGLSDIQVYNNSQLRADKLLAQAKEAFAKGNLVMAKNYLAEYDNLVAVSAGEEISHEVEKRVWDSKTREYKLESVKVVDATRASTLNTALSREKAGHDFRLQLSKSEEAREIALANSKLESKKLDLIMQKQQITLQKEALKLTADLIEALTGQKAQIDFTEVDMALKMFDVEIDRVTNKQRKLKLDVGADQIKKEVDDATKPIEREPIEKDMVIHIVGGVGEKIEALTREAESEPITKTVEADTAPAFNTIYDYIEKAEQPTTSNHNANLSSANSAINSFRSKAQQPMYSTLYVKTIQTNQLGGLIHAQASIPRFNEGGHLDNGIGHSRKSGALGGYGGGDKIKALLEAGEFIIRKEAVQSLGLGRLHMLNKGMLPRFNMGGSVAPIQRFNTGGGVNATTSSSRTVDLNLNIGGQQFQMVSEESVAVALESYIRKSM